jgi:nicotinamidase-related amidase
METSAGPNLALTLRRRVETFVGSSQWASALVPLTIPAAATALLLCDMWDDHWCRAAAGRVDALAPRMNAVVAVARARGILIIHAPSETMDFYAGTPPRERARAVPLLTPPPLRQLADPPLPIDDSDGGCDSGQSPWFKAWSRQHPAIEIAGTDLVADSGDEIYSLLRQQERSLLLIMGVHTNMCVLQRSFGIKQMTRWGMRCALVRDLTDALYNPAQPPYVSQAEGTQLVIEYIERYWCPSIASSDLLEGAAG